LHPNWKEIPNNKIPNSKRDKSQIEKFQIPKGRKTGKSFDSQKLY
jgi:hypothetical protein